MTGSRHPLRFAAGPAIALALAGCGSSSGDGGNSSGVSGEGGPSSSGQACQPPNLDGSVFGGTGTAILTGAGTLPDGIHDGLELEVLVKTGIASYGVLPDNLLTSNDRICGKSFSYTVRKLAAGTYTLTFEVFDTNSTSTMPVFEGTAPNDFTIADGQMLTKDTTFQLSPM